MMTLVDPVDVDLGVTDEELKAVCVFARYRYFRLIQEVGSAPENFPEFYYYREALARAGHYLWEQPGYYLEPSAHLEWDRMDPTQQILTSYDIERLREFGRWTWNETALLLSSMEMFNSLRVYRKAAAGVYAKA